MNKPTTIKSEKYRFDAFENGEVLCEKKKGRLPIMGWNSWNAFGSGNTEALTKMTADKLVELGLDEKGYTYVVLDDGCYNATRTSDGHLDNEVDKFPSGFKVLADYIHAKNLKFGMYNDIGTKLCSGLEVGTCGYEAVDAKDYVSWDIDFIKIDNCYYLWDNATFSDPENAKYTYAPNIKSIVVTGNNVTIKRSAIWEGTLVGKGAKIADSFVTGIGTFDGTGPDSSPIGALSSELEFEITVPTDGEYDIQVEYDAGREIGKGSFLQIAVGRGESSELVFDDMLPEKEEYAFSEIIKVNLKEGVNILRLMNHRRQENTLNSYATFVEALNDVKPDHDIILSICEWGKTQPQNWGYKVGDSWRILNDITFQVGSDGDPGHGAWESDYTTSITAQYNKAVIMDEFAGLDKGWNDPDMLMIGMNGLDETMNRTHMSLWCMLNSPLMLGIDLRRVNRGDSIYNIISNDEVISLNQDTLGIQAKRIYSSLETVSPDKVYLRDNKRVDVLAKPLSNGDVALCYVNLNKDDPCGKIEVSVSDIVKFIGSKMINSKAFASADSYEVTNLWTGEKNTLTDSVFAVKRLDACEAVVLRISAK